MAAYRSFLLLVFASSVLSKGEPLFESCNTNDFKCLSTSLATFFAKTYNGIPAYDIKPLDPLVIPELDVVIGEGLGLVLKFKNLNVTGLKNQQVTYFQMDKDKRSLVFKMKTDLNIVGDLTNGFNNQVKGYSSLYTATTTVLGSTQHSYSIVRKGDQDYFIVDPATTTCEIIGEPNVSIDSNLLNTLRTDPDTKDMKPTYENNKESLRKKTLCKIVEATYITIKHNIRAASKSFPKSAFFKDL